MKMFIFLLLLSPTLFATQTRLLALGMEELDNDGSYYIKDDRNIFINPAHVNDYGNFVLLDVGGAGQDIGANETTVSTLEQPKALGGFLIKSGKVVWGAYLGNESNTATSLRILASSGAAAANGFTSASTPQTISPELLPSADRQLDLFAGWGESLQWGANFYVYNPGKNDPEGTTTNSGFGIRLGVKDPDRKKDFNINLSLGNKVVNNYSATILGVPGFASGTQEFDGNLGLFIGGSYQFKPLRLIAWLKTFSWDQSDTGTYPPSNWSSPPLPAWPFGGQNGTVKGEMSVYNLGIGNEIDLFPRLKFFWNLYVRQSNVDVEYSKKASAESLIFPLVFASEWTATDWLQFRASIYQNLIGVAKNENYSSLNVAARQLATELFGEDNGGNTSSMPAKTKVNFGSSLLFGGLKIDGLLGVDGVDLVDFSQFYARAAVSYLF